MVVKDSAQTDRDGAIQANNILGLNTVANPATLPYNATPFTLNTTYTPGGSVQKRGGTRTVEWYSSATGSTEAVYIHPIRTALGYNFVLRAQNTGFQIIEPLSTSTFQDGISGPSRTGPEWQVLLTKDDVWTDAITSQHYDFTELDRGRILICTGVNAPVEVRVREFTTTAPTTGSGQSFDVPTSWHENYGDRTPTASNALRDSLIIYVNGVRQDPATTVTTTDYESVTFTGNLNTDDRIDIIRIVWGWWAEARVWFGDRLFNNNIRFRVDDADRTVEIPEKLRDGQYMDSSSAYGAGYAVGYGTILSVPGSFGDFTFGTGATSSDYFYSNGTTAIQNSNENVTVGTDPTHITFAALHTAGQFNENTNNNSVNVVFARFRAFEFSGGLDGDSVAGKFVDPDTELLCWLKQENQLLRQDIIGATHPAGRTFVGAIMRVDGLDPYLRNASAGLTANGFVFYQHPTGGPEGSLEIRRGIPQDQQVLAINLKTDYIGPNAQTARTQVNDDGFVVAGYGLNFFCDYSQGVFPHVSALFNNRLVFSGIATDPLRIFMSAPGDAYVSGEKFTYFQPDIDNAADTAPIDFVLSNTTSNDFIRAMEPMFGSLFVFSRDAVWRVLPTLTTQKSANFGPNTARAVSASDGRLFFATTDGVFEMVQSEGLSDSYVPSEISTPIRDKFPQLVLTYMGFDEKRNRLALSDDTGFDLYVFFTDTGSWSQWQFGAYGNNALKGFVNYWDDTDTYQFGYSLYQTQNTEGPPTPERLMTVQQEDLPYSLDFINRDGFVNADFIKYDYDVTVDIVTSPRVGYMIPLRNEGLKLTNLPSGNRSHKVYLNTVEQSTSAWDYWGKGFIFLAALVADGDTITVEPLVPEKTYNPHELVTTDDGEYVGFVYPACWTSGQFTYGSMGAYKRVTHLNLFLDNRNVPVGFDYPTEVEGTQEALFIPYGRHLLNTNLSLYFQNDAVDETFTDLYSVTDAYYQQQQDYTLLRYPCQGIGYDFQFMLWTFSPDWWSLAGFQLDGNMKGKRYPGRSV